VGEARGGERQDDERDQCETDYLISRVAHEMSLYRGTSLGARDFHSLGTSNSA
jgi:hypothetical protein